MSTALRLSLASLLLTACVPVSAISEADLEEALTEHNADPEAHGGATTGEPTTDASALTSGTLDPARLPSEVVVESELTAALSGISATTDASDLTSGTLDPARLPSEVALAAELTAAARGGTAGVQVTSFAGSVAIDSTTTVELLSLDVTTATVTNVVVTAHAYLERSGATTGRYDLSLRLTSCSGTLIGETFWRPSTSSDSYVADAVTLTGFAPSVNGAVTIKFCGSKYDGGAPTATAGFRGMIAHW